MNNVTLTADVNSKVNLVKSIANKTRGPYTPEKYGNVIIPMAIIRRFDCILADTAFSESDISKLFDAEDFGYTKVTMECPLYDENGKKLIKRGVVQVDSKRRDTETIPLKQDVDEYIKAEVLPYVPEAFPDRSKDKIGYEIPFTRYFYQYVPPRKSSDILQEIIENEAALQQTLKAVLK